MTQYSPVKDRELPEEVDVERRHSDASPLLGQGSSSSQKAFPVADAPQATVFSSCINLANTILGAGMFAMPSAIASVGLLIGSGLIGFSGCASGLGLYLLARCASRVDGRNASFNTISLLSYPDAAIWFDSAIAIKCFGVSISYLIVIGDLMPEVMDWFGVGSAYKFLLDRRFWITVFMLFIIPLTFLRKLDSLRYTSFVALSAVVYLLIIVVYHYVDPERPSPPPEEIHWVNFSEKFLARFPIFVFAFTCHQNIFTVYNELHDNSDRQVNSVIYYSIGASFLVYQTVGVLGYLTFGDHVLGNIIKMYDNGLVLTIGRFALVILVMFSYPLQAHPCRASVDKVLNVAFHTNLEVPQYEEEDGKPDDTPQPHSYEISNLRFFTITPIIIVSTYLIAISVSQLDLVLSFVGSTGSTAISFILPGLFYTKIHQNDPWNLTRILAVMLLVYGVCVMTICLSYNIYHLF
ncbi:putative AVT6-involved in amino acid efflux from the vacuole [Basidiobolus meristosporus CBS 931.73]|uniref:Putative AVT6-involved in amino acid efflux from the vacuole n=1 Tax=Basidiobolus meristosporus CBS 931.73 TaxID=1314790 RepID=A0A1Y1Z1Q4_9FUNG|nr:putative AVT6-involved in amino acid efflux from the vacuole [Basidiobolus meristosporus CBS 931.73]ORY04228.1 putative AVT6-involved in amino acid efflux from the vacuole [Basidiobolus meristosporus CBS 931.73]|eukprot:ORX65075.1 putative AVT6-involved in amino acid efflux from the vacuole [Basidiobolus meristosporus CBS 931.73]